MGIILEKHPSFSAYLSGFEYISKIDRGVSGDGKHRIRRDGRDFLLRIASGEKYAQIKQELDWLKTLSEAGLPVPECVDLTRSRDGARVFTLLSWIPGEDLEHLLPELSRDRQYACGFQASEILRRIHEVSDHPVQDWYDRYRTVMEPQLDAFLREKALFEGSECVLRYLEEHYELLKTRPLCPLHEDYHIGNLILNNGKLFVIDWHPVYFNNLGDPWYAFHCLRTEYPAFVSGQIDGYFHSAVPEEFWQLFAFYYSAGILSTIVWLNQTAPGELNQMQELHRRVLQMFNGMQDPHPMWYGTPSA